jgi:hypothetical protein
MKTTYGAEAVEEPEVKDVGLEALEAKHLELAKEEYAAIQRHEEDKKAKVKQAAVDRLRVANLYRSLEAKERKKAGIQEKYLAAFLELIATGEEDIALLTERDGVLVELKALGENPNDNCDTMLDGGPMAQEIFTYTERQIHKIMKAWREGAELTPSGIATAI